jgi:hypothetical protein
MARGMLERFGENRVILGVWARPSHWLAMGKSPIHALAIEETRAKLTSRTYKGDMAVSEAAPSPEVTLLPPAIS